MHKNTKRLRELMAAARLNAPAVAELLNREAQTVRGWRVKTTTRPIPSTALELLELKLQQRGGL